MKAIVGTCYVCGERVVEVPIEERLAARRGMNVPVRIGGDIVRHSYCEMGSTRWMEAMSAKKKAGTLTTKEKKWLKLYENIERERRQREARGGAR